MDKTMWHLVCQACLAVHSVNHNHTSAHSAVLLYAHNRPQTRDLLLLFLIWLTGVQSDSGQSHPHEGVNLVPGLTWPVRRCS
jgi:hypothetical protein